MTKVLHVHFMASHKNYYFGSVSAIFKEFTTEEIGCSAAYLQHLLTEDGNHYLNGKVLIVRSHLRR